MHLYMHTYTHLHLYLLIYQVDSGYSILIHTEYREFVYLRQDVSVNGSESIPARETESKYTEVSLQTRVDSETTGRRVHARNVLCIVHFLKRQFGSVIPMAVVEVLPNECMRLYSEVLVHLSKAEVKVTILSQ